MVQLYDLKDLGLFKGSKTILSKIEEIKNLAVPFGGKVDFSHVVSYIEGDQFFFNPKFSFPFESNNSPVMFDYMDLFGFKDSESLVNKIVSVNKLISELGWQTDFTVNTFSLDNGFLIFRPKISFSLSISKE
jgi:hypothetical protein